MQQHEFTIFLDRQPTEDDYDRLYEAGFDDSAPGVENGRGVIHVTRHAADLPSALRSALSDANKAGFRVVGVQDEDLVSLKTIAARIGKTYEALRLLACGKRGPGGFPPPLGAEGWTLYSWTAVARWFEAQGVSVPALDERATTLAATDHLLRARALVDQQHYDELDATTRLVAVEALRNSPLYKQKPAVVVQAQLAELERSRNAAGTIAS